VEPASFHPFGANNFEVAVKCLENSCIPALEDNIERIFSE
jgi:hypothetical protein